MTDATEPEDERGLGARLAAQVHAGDRDAESEFVALYGPRLRFVLLRLTGDPARAEDLCHEGLVVGLVRLRDGSVRDPERLGGFLYGVARNLLRNEDRTASVRATQVDTEFIEQVADGDAAHEDAVHSAEVGNTVRRLLTQLPSDRYREILVRHYVREEDKATICEAMQLSSLHFNRVLWRARSALRKLASDQRFDVEVRPRAGEVERD
jgi:RNA polymerase sigma-70 factor (ECF subfamily)